MTKKQEIAERERLEEALRKSEQKFRDLIEGAIQAISIHRDGAIVYSNQAFADLVGLEIDKVIGRSVLDFTDDRDAEITRERLRKRRRGEYVPPRNEFRIKRSDGSSFTVDSLVREIQWEGEPAVQTTLVDITERRQAEEAQRKSEAQIRLITDSLPVLIAEMDPEMRFRFVNKIAEKWYGQPREKIIGKPLADVLGEPVYERIRSRVERVNRGESIDENNEIVFPDGVTRNIRSILVPKLGPEGENDGHVALILDITEQMRAENELRESADRLRRINNALPLSVAYGDSELRLRYANATFLARYGLQFEDIEGKTALEIDGGQAYEILKPHLQMALSGQTVMFEAEIPYKTMGNRFVETSYVPDFDTNGNVVGIYGFTNDVTDRREIEDQLRQAQKMEAVGQLTGGIAHDFNNLLTVVQGNLELLSEELGDQARAKSLTDAALRAAERGGVLTHRLLAFSRKQALRPQGLNLHELISDMTALLRRTLGEAIEIETKIGDDLWHALADPGQVEAAVLNLALNARDSMPTGGKLTIELTNVRFDDEYAEAQADIAPGEYVQISVSDTGTGIPAETLVHVFEPFYTTKEVGKGSGLGLSMVYGFAKQSGGHVTIYSEENHGTTVNLYLPCTIGEVGQLVADAARDEPKAEYETILVVEDDPDVRTLAVTLLGDLGYEVLEASDGPSAIAAMKSRSRIDLLFTDVVLAGGMSGPEVAEEAKRLQPAMRVLFMSGYPSEAMVRRGELEQGVNLLNKPFRKADLARKVRDALRMKA